jgi:hypothetical protein
MVIGAYAADAETMGGATGSCHVDPDWRPLMAHGTPDEKRHPAFTPEEHTPIEAAGAEDVVPILDTDPVEMPSVIGELPVNQGVRMTVADVLPKHRPNASSTHWNGSFGRDHIGSHMTVIRLVGT